MSKQIKVWERSPLSCSHDAERYDYGRGCCGKCGSKDVKPIRMQPAKWVSEFSDDAMDFAAQDEAAIRANRV